MTRFVTLTVQVRPHAEQVEVDGIKFTKPEELWGYLHGEASALARKPGIVSRSLFVSDESLQAIRDAVYAIPPGGVAITRLPPKGKELAGTSTRQSVEELGL